MARLFRRWLLILTLLTGFAYAIDHLYGIMRNTPGEDVKIDRYYAVAEKFNKIDYERTDSITERCVYTLFPQFGHNPCWYVQRHTLRFIKVG